MTTAVHPLPLPGASPLLVKLLEVVRPEFLVELIRLDPDHPAFTRGRCTGTRSRPPVGAADPNTAPA